MIGASKILTVSYGTFSCTLEGFDEPFNTMKAIAEYFRDLAADDRYFGAEPPTPDAAMLHKIAEREIQRRVETSIKDNSVILRAAEPAEAPVALPVTSPVEAVSAAVAEPEVEAVIEALAEEPVAEAVELVVEDLPMVVEPAGFELNEAFAEAEAAPVAEVVAEAEAVPQPALADAMPEGVAAKLARLRQAVAGSASVAEAAMGPVALADEHFEDEHAGQAPDAGDLREVFADLAEDDVAVEAAVEAAGAPDDDGMLERLGGLLEEPAAMDEVNAAFDPAPAVASTDAAAEPDVADLIATLAGGAAEVAETAAAVDPFADDADFEDDDGLYDLAEEPQPVSLPEMSEALNDNLPEALAEEADFDVEEDLPQSFAADVAEETAMPEPVAEAEPAAAEVAAPAAAEVAAEALDKAQRARARVIKIRRADVAPAADAAPSSEAGPVSANRDEELSRLLAQADTEMSEPENRRRLEAIQHLKAAVAATVADRRAGVKEPSEEERADIYREDLARAVRPVRPRAAGAVRREERPEVETTKPEAADAPVAAAPADRPAPLVLVSEQRIDRAAPARVAPVAPVRPRRLGGAAVAASAAVAQSGAEMDVEDDLEADLEAALMAEEFEDGDEAGTENIFADSKGFAEFAERVGANDLPDLLEAAAAYATCMEDREHFTRPLLMRRLEAGQLGDTFSREEGLIGFGTLLREGRIEKIRRGHYAINAKSGYLAEARKLAQ